MDQTGGGGGGKGIGFKVFIDTENDYGKHKMREL